MYIGTEVLKSAIQWSAQDLSGIRWNLMIHLISLASAEAFHWPFIIFSIFSAFFHLLTDRSI